LLHIGRDRVLEESHAGFGEAPSDAAA
jgi:hypothetical protein